MTETTTQAELTDDEKRREGLAKRVKALLDQSADIRRYLASGKAADGHKLSSEEIEQYEVEAEGFWAKAQAMLTKHSVDAELKRMTEQAKGVKTEQPVEKKYFLTDGPYLKSRCQLASFIGSAMGLKTLLASTGIFVIYIGFPEDAKAAWEMFQLIEPQMMENVRRRVKEGEHKRMLDYSTKSMHVSAKSYTITYCEGFALRIQLRLRQVRSEAAESVVVAEGTGPEREGRVTGTLVLAGRQAAIEAAYNKLYPVVKVRGGVEKRQGLGSSWKGSQASHAAMGARHHGSEDGKKARIRTDSELNG